MGFINKIFIRVINFFIFRRKILKINSRYIKNSSYFEKKELSLSNFLKNKTVDISSYNDYSYELAELIADFFDSNGFKIKDFSSFIAGKIVYNKTGFTPDNTQQLLVKYYSISNGLFQEIFHEFLYKDFGLGSESTFIESEIFGKVSSQEILSIVNVISKDGYVVLPKLVPEGKINSIKDWSYNIKYNVVDNFENRYLVNNVDFNSPDVVTANALEEDLVNNDDIKDLIFDPVIMAIISKYLGVDNPILIHLCMWWTFKSNNLIGSSEAAQLYHYDLDHIKWLKVFFYLTDVDEEDGPHVYIPESHISGNKNYKLLERGYSRVGDSEMSSLQNGKPKRVLGHSGTVIIGDTKCFHKGSPVISNSRLVLQPTFGPSNFLKNLKN